MARGIELDWVVVRVHTLRKIAAVAALGLLATAAVIFAYSRLNLPPEARARRAIERAETARTHADSQPTPKAWQQELAEAAKQLDEAHTAYTDERWDEAERLAEAATGRFEALIGISSDELVGVGQFFSLDGRVQIQRAGQNEWETAHVRLPVFNGDFVKTGKDGAAEILFSDGTMYRIAPNSLLEIHHRDSQSAGGGAVKMVVGRINVYTSSSSSTVTTDASQTEIGRDSRIAVDVADADNGRTTVSAYQGSAVVRAAAGGGAVRLGTREVVAADARTGLQAKARLPEAPTPVEPINNMAFDLERDRIIELRWDPVETGAMIDLEISRNKRFIEGEMEVDATGLRRDGARLRAVSPGTYFWRIALVTSAGVRSDWSAVRRFRIYSASRHPLLEDRTPPELEIEPPQQLGNMFIVEGRTDPGATVTVNGEPVEPDSGGHFRKAIEFRQDGWNDLVVIAVDPSGNPAERRERVFVEVF